MTKIKAILAKIGHVLKVVINDTEVRRSTKQFIVLVSTRLLLAAGASVSVIALIVPALLHLLGL